MDFDLTDLRSQYRRGFINALLFAQELHFNRVSTALLTAFEVELLAAYRSM